FIFNEGFLVNKDKYSQGSNQLDTSQLELDAGLEGGSKVFEPASIELVRQVTPYQFNTPDYLPFELIGDPEVTIKDWDGTRKNVFLEINYSSEEPGSFINIEISNFKNIVNSTIETSSYQEVIQLDRSLEAYYQQNENVSMLSWIDGKIEYTVNYFLFKKDGVQSQSDSELIKEDLIRMAESMQSQ
ncbi:hypothetical protein ACOI1C_03860, partial [Bacillus sp. DJP31]|uniref:hypothetical protein n=1 Tax=Bacillus sp. DJP31 TaxID=3409789 RepID=UPI003BB5D0FC